MGLVMFKILTLIGNGIHNIFLPFGIAVKQVLVLFCKPFAAAGAFLGRVGTLTFTVLHLVLRTLYYIIVLWLLIYMLNLLYCFVQHRDFTIQGEYYFRSSPRRDHSGQGQQTLTIAPVLLDQ